jgi:hypothetical protein
MKACSVYILGFRSEIDHNVIIRGISNKIKALRLSPGERYEPHFFLCEEEDSIEKALSTQKVASPDIVISVGLGMTLALKRLYQTIDPIETLFLGIYDPKSYNLINSLEKPGGYMSGVCIEPLQTFTGTQDLLKPFAPFMPKIFMPYDTRLDQNNFSIEAIIRDGVAPELRRLNFEVTTQKVNSYKETFNAIFDNLKSHHAVISSGLHLDVEAELTYICKMSDRVLISDKGITESLHNAGLTFNSTHSALCDAAIKLLRLWWQNRTPIGRIPIIKLQSNYGQLIVNKFMLPWWLQEHLYETIKPTSDTIITNTWVSNPIHVPKKT